MSFIVAILQRQCLLQLIGSVAEPAYGVSQIKHHQATTTAPYRCVIIDTEFTAWEGSAQRQWSAENEHRELIQIGAVKLTMTQTSCVVSERLNILIKPVINPNLSDYIINLTGISQPMVDEHGVDAASAVTTLYHFCEHGHLPVWCWGTDNRVLEENAKLGGFSLPEFDRGIHNLQALLLRYGVLGSEKASGELACALQLQLTGHAHNALYDTESIAAAMSYWLSTQVVDLRWITGAT
ncbi:exonuclease domain-containing protein [Alteromonas sp. H39]|uniref:exonuclease domain-containing protein n=1 Tax=Alteromonas sp. H39 TaxID=3389876 RepID=UPI0039DFA566